MTEDTKPQTLATLPNSGKRQPESPPTDAISPKSPATDAASPDSQAPAAGNREAGAREIGGPAGPEPTRYGDWERNGRCSDF
jgi:hypothetical protein